MGGGGGGGGAVCEGSHLQHSWIRPPYISALTNVMLKFRKIDDIFGTRDSNVPAKIVDGLRSVPSTAKSVDGGNPGVVPSADGAAGYQLEDFALRELHVLNVKSCKFKHVGSPDVETLENPVIEVSSHFEFERAEERMEMEGGGGGGGWCKKAHTQIEERNLKK